MTARRPDSPSWTTAKEHGDAAELALAEFYKARDCDVTKTFGLDGYDLLVQSRLEVKNDLLALKTGNLAIEVSCGGKPSGIMATRADRYVMVVGHEAFVFRTVQLLALVNSNNFKAAPGGDGHRATLRLVPLSFVRNLDIVQTLDLSRFLG